MAFLAWLNGWLIGLRPILETLSFLATLALAAFAYKALEQLRIAKETNRVNARREAFKLAAAECRTFAETIAPHWERINGEIAAHRVTVFDNPQFTLRNGEFQQHNFQDEQLRNAFLQVEKQVIAFLNLMEGFAIFFADGIAEEPIGYRETGRAFCQMVKRFMPAIHYLRVHGFANYESTLKLYELWSDKIASEHLIKTEASLSASLTDVQTARSRIRPRDIPTVGDQD